MSAHQTFIDHVHQAFIDAGAIYIGEWLSSKWYEASDRIIMKACSEVYSRFPYCNGYPSNWTGGMDLVKLTKAMNPSLHKYWYTTSANIWQMRSWGCFENEDPSIVD